MPFPKFFIALFSSLGQKTHFLFPFLLTFFYLAPAVTTVSNNYLTASFGGAVTLQGSNFGNDITNINVIINSNIICNVTYVTLGSLIACSIFI